VRWLDGVDNSCCERKKKEPAVKGRRKYSLSLWSSIQGLEKLKLSRLRSPKREMERRVICVSLEGKKIGKGSPEGELPQQPVCQAGKINAGAHTEGQGEIRGM